jgi:uncharacterized protein YegJ (DUF2314 family)
MKRIVPVLLASCLALLAAHPAVAAKKAAKPASTKSAEKKAEKKEAADVTDIDPNDPDMKAAVQKAQDTLETVLKISESKDPKYDAIAVRINVRDGALSEYIWMNPFHATEKGYAGTIGNSPAVVKNVKGGQEFEFARTDIVDWMYVDKEAKAMYGNFTTCVLMKKRAKPDEIAQIKAAFGLDCEAQ